MWHAQDKRETQCVLMGEPLQQRDHMVDLHICSGAFLNWVLMKQDRSGRDSSGLE